MLFTSNPRIINALIMSTISRISCLLLSFFFMASSAGAAENPNYLPLPEKGANTDNMLQQLTVEREPITEDLINIHFHDLPKAEYIGFIIALEKGFYQDAGLPNISLQWPDSPDNPNEFSLNALTPLCVKDLATAIALSEETNSIRIAQLSQRSDLAVITMVNSGITKLSDLNLKIFQAKNGDALISLDMLLMKNSITPKKIFSLGQDPSVLLNGIVDACVMRYFDEYHTLLQRAVRPEELTVFRLYEYGVGLPGIGIDTLPLYLKNNPLICQAAVEATIKGYFYAFSHREESLNSLMSYMERYKSLSNRSHQTWMLEQIYQTYTFSAGSDPRNWGYLDEGDCKRAINYIFGSAAAEQADIGSFYSTLPRGWDKPKTGKNEPPPSTGAELED